MSRTYRTVDDHRYNAGGRLWSWPEYRDYIKGCRCTHLGWSMCRYVTTYGRDQKPWNKPPKWFKQERRRQERSRVRTAMRSGRDIPEFRKGDQWDWT